MSKRSYNFPPMLGPCEDYPEGSPEWALRLAARTCYSAQSHVLNGAGLIRSVRKAMTVQPWTVWPKGSPCGSSAERYFELCGLSLERLIGLAVFCQEDDLVRVLQAAKRGAD